MARYFNITGASSAAAELTRELLAAGDNAGISMQAAGAIHSGDITYKVTSVWETEILI